MSDTGVFKKSSLRSRVAKILVTDEHAKKCTHMPCQKSLSTE